MPLQKVLLKPGVNRENTRYTTEGGWYDGNKVRFRQGTPEKIGGWEQISSATFEGICRSLWTWSSLSGVDWIGVGTNLKYYVEQGLGYYDITPIRATTGNTPLSGPFVAITPQTFTVTIASPAVLTAATLNPIVDGAAFTFTTTGNLPTGLSVGTTYYAVNSATNTCQLALTKNGQPIVTTGTQSGTHTLSSTTITVTDASHGASTGDFVSFRGAIALSTQTYTANAGTDVITFTTALANGTAIQLFTTGTAPGGLAVDTRYYVVSAVGTTCKLAVANGGTPIDITSAGTGTQTFELDSGITAAVLNSNFQVTVLTGNIYTIDAPVTAVVSDTGNGGSLVSAYYEIPVGVDATAALYGWGAGTWGAGTWGNGASSFIYPRRWNANNFGQDLVAGYAGAELYYWNATTGVEPVKFNSVTSSSQTFTVTIASPAVVTWTGVNNLSNGTPVKLTTTGALPTGLNTTTTYYVVNAGTDGANKCRLSLTVGGADINTSGAQSGIQTMLSPTLFVYSSGLLNGTAVMLETDGTLPTGFLTGVIYYVVQANSTTNTFQLSATAGGSAIIGTGSNVGNAYVANRMIPISSLAYSDGYAPLFQNYFLISDASRFTLVFGTNDIGGTELDPMLIRWSDQESLTTWYPQVTNQAGFVRLSHGSQIITALQVRQEILVWTDASLYSLQYLGAPYVWGSQLLMDNISIVSQSAVSLASGVTYWMGLDKFYKYDGRVQTLRCDLRQYIFQDINRNQFEQIFSGTNEGFNEVWWFYCSTNSVTIDKYVVYNYAEDVWYYGTMERTAWQDSALNGYPVAATYANNLVFHEYGNNDNIDGTPAAISAYITSSEYDIGDGHNFGFVWRLLPDVTFRGSDVASPDKPTVTMTLLPLQNSGSGYTTPPSVGGTDNAPVVQTRAPTAVQIEEFTGQINVRVRGRQMSLKIESNQLGCQWQLGSPRIDIRPDGRRGG